MGGWEGGGKRMVKVGKEKVKGGKRGEKGIVKVRKKD